MGCGGGTRLLLGFRSGTSGVFGGLFPGGLMLPGIVGRLARALLVGFALVGFWCLLSFVVVGGAASGVARSWLLLVVWGVRLSSVFFPSSPHAVWQGRLQFTFLALITFLFHLPAL